jgi:glucosamine--fructose-6-phosphate aminotransferase (isomerizing)
MCGIVGYIGKREAEPILLEGLRRLEYRGYDSAGVAILDGDTLDVQKAKGRLQNLAERLAFAPLHGRIGIGHTRWATHGEPSDLNAHPHTDVKGRIAVVHNGIIENHEALRSHLKKQGCVFISQTDTEVIAHLLTTLYDGDMLKTVQRAVSYLEGSYALGIVSLDTPDCLYCVRKDSPLVIGIGKNEQFIASDVPALLHETREVLYLEDGHIGVLKKEGVTLYDGFLHPLPVKTAHITWNADGAERGGYPHFMLKEIYEEPAALLKTLNAHPLGHFPLTKAEAMAAKKLTIAACGTAYHAGVIGRYAIEKLSGLPVEAELASEFRYREPQLCADDLFLAVSQSGETADTLAALREAKRLGAKALALTNVLGSSIAREVGDSGVMYTYAGPEIAVASTKAYITQVEMLLLFAIDLAVKRERMTGNQAEKLIAELKQIPVKAEKLLEDVAAIQRFADRHFDHKHVFYIGRGLDYALALEASLKLKEVSYIFSEAYAAGELKHGTIALIEPGSLVTAIITQPHLLEKSLSNVKEVKARGAKVLIIAPESMREKVESEADALWLLPDAPAIFMPLLAVIPLQLLAYYMAVAKGCDVDKPRNLAKSVTVE